MRLRGKTLVLGTGRREMERQRQPVEAFLTRGRSGYEVQGSSWKLRYK